jgi:protease-4
MLSFFKYVLATIVGFVIFSFVVVITLVAIAMKSMPEDEVSSSDNSILKLKLDAPIVEREPIDIWARFQPFSGSESSIGLVELKEAISQAKSDSSIKGIWLEASNLDAGFASIEEIREALVDFKSANKFVLAYGEYYSEKSYFLASVADKIILPPTGILEFNGLESEILFLKGALEKLEIKAEIFKVGDFKSAVEPLMLDKMSEPNRIQTQSFLNSINQTFLQKVSESRGIDLETLKQVSDSMQTRNASDALKHGLITDVAYYDAAEEYIRSKLKTPESEDLNFVSYKSYRKLIDKNLQNKAIELDNQIAVIVANGEIISGKGNDNTIGSESLCDELRKARKNEKVKAVVLRINSPGGSALASDVIWREVVLLKKKKPIIASMSDVAASGGYYIAMACDTIVAMPTSITGSIGVFGVTFNAENFLKNKLGITSDRVTTGKFSDIGTPTRAMSMAEKQIIQNEVERIYGDFTSKAAEGRNIPVENLLSVASGRVWSGSEGIEKKLVDVSGSLEKAISIAASSANIQNYNTVYYPKAKDEYWAQLISQLGNEEEEVMAKKLGIFYPYYKNLNQLKHLEGIQARMPFAIDIK